MKSDWQFYTICELKDAISIVLYIHDWQVLHFPLTYTAQECIETWCDLVGWELKSIRPDSFWRGRVHYNLPSEEYSVDTIRRTARTFNRSLLEGTA